MNLSLYAGSLEGDAIVIFLSFCGMMASSSAIVLKNMVGKVN